MLASIATSFDLVEVALPAIQVIVEVVVSVLLFGRWTFCPKPKKGLLENADHCQI